MKKGSASNDDDDLLPEYDLSKLKGGTRGKYYQQARTGTNLVLIDPDLARAFPDQQSVNRALRVLLRAASAATTKVRKRGVASNKRPQSGRKSTRASHQ